MLRLPKDGATTTTIVGIDPGTETLGVAIMTISLLDYSILSTEARTFHGSKLAGKESWLSEVFGSRTDRVKAHEENLLNIFNSVKPLLIASESPFYNQRFPQAYGALMEVICAIRSAVMRHSNWKSLGLFDPPTVKNAVGAQGNADKNTVYSKVIALNCLNYTGLVPITELDEHSIDAIAVAYCQYKNIDW